jgi:hypothetical protein
MWLRDAIFAHRKKKGGTPATIITRARFYKTLVKPSSDARHKTFLLMDRKL